MRLVVAHRLAYAYDHPVFLDPHTLRLRPRDEPDQRLVRYELDVNPSPAGRSAGLDVWGNAFECLWFERRHERLELSMRAEVEVLRRRPFDYLITHADATELPMSYPGPEAAALSQYLTRSERAESVDEWARDVADSKGPGVVTTVGALAAAVQATFDAVVRPEGDSWAPGETLARGEGACRDLAVLFVDACRALGIAARFVSGYALAGQPNADHALHAWAEVYVPGGGWRGYDPSLGLAITNRHIALAAAPEPSGAAPTDGSFRGQAVTTFTYDVTVETLSDPAAS